MKQNTEIRILKKNSDFRSVYSSTNYRFSVKNFILLVKKNSFDYNRFGFVVSSKVGKAVVRNKIRRRLKVIGKEIMHLTKKPYDYVIIAKSFIKDAKFCEIKQNLIYSLKKLNLNIVDIKRND